MLAKIAAATEASPLTVSQKERNTLQERKPRKASEALALVVHTALETVSFSAVFVPSKSGDTARMISRFRPSAWIVALTTDPFVGQSLCFSYGVHPVHVDEFPKLDSEFFRQWMGKEQVQGDLAILVSGPSENSLDENHSLQFVRVNKKMAEV